MLDDFVPSVSIDLSYASENKAVDLGNTIKPKHASSQPIFNIFNTEVNPTPTRKDNATYVLALTDPDATSHSHPIKAQMCHWIAMNITIPVASSLPVILPGLTGVSGGSNINELMPYFPPSPPPKTGYHRYVFVVLTSKSLGSGEDLEKPKARPHWGYEKIGSGVREWAEENNLAVVGK